MDFTVFHKGKTYCLNTADDLYIFGLGIEMNIEEKLQTDIITFVDFIRQCHKTDCCNAPLKPFTTFITDWWNELHNKDKLFIVNKFYEIKNQ